jgi:chemotaxis protein methyltransferase CheR
MKNIPPMSRDDFSLFQVLLTEESGLFFEEDRNLPLRMALWDRMKQRNISSYRAYYDFLKSHPERMVEFQKLLDGVTTGETYFFRGKAQFRALIDDILPEIAGRKSGAGDRCVRIWSAGCSRGDETYSLAIALMENLPEYESWTLEILGTDINRSSLICAKEAVYGERDATESRTYRGYTAKYLQKTGLGYLLDERVRRMPRFEYHNLAKDPYAQEGMRNLDVIFCRNVMIYFDLPLIRKVVGQFYDCLAPGGYLFLGHAETLWHINDRFETVEFPQTIIYRKPLPGKVSEIIPQPAVPVPEIEEDIFEGIETEKPPGFCAPPGAPPPPPTPTSDLGAILLTAKQMAELAQYEDALVLLNGVMARDQNQTLKIAYYIRANILANLGRYEEAVADLEKTIALENLLVDAYYLLGVLDVKGGRWKEAETQFRKVLYIEPKVVMAYFNLGHIYLSKKNLKKAALEFTNAIRLLNRMSRDERIRFCQEYTVEFLLKACHSVLAGINEEK